MKSSARQGFMRAGGGGDASPSPITPTAPSRFSRNPRGADWDGVKEKCRDAHFQKNSDARRDAFAAQQTPATTAILITIYYTHTHTHTHPHTFTRAALPMPWRMPRWRRRTAFRTPPARRWRRVSG
jgi:hypothetical protein